MGTEWLDGDERAARGHVSTVRRQVLEPLRREQWDQLRAIGDALLTRLVAEGRMTALHDPDQGADRNGSAGPAGPAQTRAHTETLRSRR